MASLSTRLVGRDLSIWTIDTANILALYAGGSLDLRIERVDITAVKDNGRTSRPSHYDWRVTANTLIASTALLMGMAYTNSLQDVAMTLEMRENGDRFSGTIGHTGFGFRFDEAATTEGAEFVGIGTLKYNNADLEVYDYDGL